jgi:opacity protein-like surface antigen
MKIPDHQIIALSSLLLISALPLQAQNSAENIRPASTAPDIYLEGDAGPLYMQDMQVHVGTKEKFKFDLGTRFDLVLGYKFAQSWSAELDCGVIWNAIDKYGAGSFSGTKADLYQFPVMVNYLYWLPIKGPLEGFVGAGVGLVVGDFHIADVAQDFKDTDATFGYQALAGLKYHLCSQVDLTLAYKFLGTTSHKWIDGDFYTQTQGSLTHSVMLGVAVKY